MCIGIKVSQTITDLSLKLKRLSRISAQKAVFAANFVKPCGKPLQDSKFSPNNLTHQKSAPLNMGGTENINPVYGDLEIRDFTKNFSEWTGIRPGISN